MANTPRIKAHWYVSAEELEMFRERITKFRIPKTERAMKVFGNLPNEYHRVEFSHKDKTIGYEFEGADIHDDHIIIHLGDKTKSI